MYKRALVPLDGSPAAEAILPFILEIAGPLDMEVVLLRVLQPIAPQILEGGGHVLVEDLDARQTVAEAYLAPVAAELTGKGVRVKAHVRHGEPATEIVAGAQEDQADLIAMTTHGRSGLGRLLFGSVAEAVLRQARLPVFLMRCTEAEVAHRSARGALERAS